MPKWLFLLAQLLLFAAPLLADESLFPISGEFAANSKDTPVFGPFLKISLNVGFVIPSNLFSFKNGDARMDTFNAKLVGTCKIQAFSGLYDTTGDIEIKVKRMLIVIHPTRKTIQLKGCLIEGTAVSMNVRKSLIRNALLSFITSNVLTDQAINSTVCSQLAGQLGTVQFPPLGSIIGRNGTMASEQHDYTDDSNGDIDGGSNDDGFNILNHLFKVGAIFLFALLVVFNIAVGRILYLTLNTEC